MRISEIFKTKRVVYSFEVFPPKKTSSVETIYNTINALGDLHPDYISVTYGAGGDGGDKTCELATLIKQKHGIEPLAHITCINSNKQQVKDTLEEFKRSGIENVLALRGDRALDMPVQTDFRYASDLVRFIRTHSDFGIAGACYPEGHPECDFLEKDIEHLKHKVDMGITHLNSQLFFDNDDFYRFLDLIRRKGITVPVQAGIMPVSNTKQIERMVSMTGAKLPGKFSRIIARYGHNPQALRDAGIAYATEQIIDLVASGVDGIHLYTMNQPLIAHKITESIASLLEDSNQNESETPMV